jgi:SAM-dependent methyltransferase
MQHQAPFELYSIYYDLIYAAKDYEAETRYVQNLIQEIQPGVTTILELGCGTGNYAKEFCNNGFTVTGLEKSEAMLQEAGKKNIHGFSSFRGDIKDFRLQGQFDAAVSLFHVMNYLTETADIIAGLKNIAAHLQPGGLFVFDAWYTPAVYAQKAESRLKEVEDEQYRVVRHAEPVMNEERNTVDVVYEIVITEKATGRHHALRETHTMRHFSTPEIELFAGLSGMKLIRSEEFLTANTPSVATWGVCYLLQKI